MGMDDDSGWNDVLLGLWSDAVRDEVVERIERLTVGRHGWLVRVFSAPEAVAAGLVETVHALVLAAIRDETGADLDELGSQAAWECYEQVWDRLEIHWRDGGDLAVARIGAEPEIVRLIQQLPPEAAVAAGADISTTPYDPLWLGGRLRVDVLGLRAYERLDGGRVPAAVQMRIQAILGRIDTPDR